MLSKKDFLAMLKKRHNCYFTVKQAVNAYILEHYDIAYVELKYNNAHFSDVIKKTKKTVFTILRDMAKAGIIEKYSQTTWKMIPNAI